MHTHRCLATLVGHNGAVRALAATDSIVFSGSDDSTIRVRAWGRRWAGQGFHSRLAGAVMQEQLQTCCRVQRDCSQPDRSSHLPALPAAAHVACPCSLESCPPPTSLQAWDANTLTCLRTLEGHEDNVRVLAVGHGHLFSGSWDKTVRVRRGCPAERHAAPVGQRSRELAARAVAGW